jgi:hemerythrin-like domain-containing protein
MIRHKSLIPLSHDHHLGLVAAQRLKRGDPAYRDMSIAASIAELWSTELEEHFEQEERWLFPLEVSDEARSMVARAIGEHARMRELVARAARGEALEETARELGAILEKHIRFEERELFERLQEEIGEGEWDRIGEGIASMRTPRSCRTGNSDGSNG